MESTNSLSETILVNVKTEELAYLIFRAWCGFGVNIQSQIPAKNAKPVYVLEFWSYCQWLYWKGKEKVTYYTTRKTEGGKCRTIES